MIAEEEGLTPQQVMVTAGTTEAIYLIAQLYRGYASVIPQPTFSEYASACKQFDHTISNYNNDAMEYLPPDRVYWLCNPNNPTGSVMQKSLINYVIRRHSQYVFVVDQAYEGYTEQEMLHIREMQDCYHLLLLHSLTKRHCIPGLRLGYITGSPIIIDRLRLLRQPWTVNALAIEAGKYLIGNHIDVMTQTQRKEYLEEARRLHRELSKIEGLMLMESDTNFMLAYLQNTTARELKQWLIENYGILIRDASNFRGLDASCFRVSAQTPEEDDVLVTAITEFMSKVNSHHV
jgi:threonine-phosphate decarboxylase